MSILTLLERAERKMVIVEDSCAYVALQGRSWRYQRRVVESERIADIQREALQTYLVVYSSH